MWLSSITVTRPAVLPCESANDVILAAESCPARKSVGEIILEDGWHCLNIQADVYLKSFHATYDYSRYPTERAIFRVISY